MRINLMKTASIVRLFGLFALAFAAAEVAGTGSPAAAKPAVAIVESEVKDERRGDPRTLDMHW